MELGLRPGLTDVDKRLLIVGGVAVAAWLIMRKAGATSTASTAASGTGTTVPFASTTSADQLGFLAALMAAGTQSSASIYKEPAVIGAATGTTVTTAAAPAVAADWGGGTGNGAISPSYKISADGYRTYYDANGNKTGGEWIADTPERRAFLMHQWGLA